MSRNYKFHNPEGVYFVSFAFINWVDAIEAEGKTVNLTFKGHKGATKTESIEKILNN